MVRFSKLTKDEKKLVFDDGGPLIQHEVPCPHYWDSSIWPLKNPKTTESFPQLNVHFSVMQ